MMSFFCCDFNIKTTNYINDIFKTIRAGIEIVVDDLKWSFDKKVIPKSKATWLTVLTALLGATLGAAFGGLAGAAVGLFAVGDEAQRVDLIAV